MTAAVELDRVGRTFGGQRALHELSTRFEPGTVTAVLGPNGAGKSTLLGLLTTLVPPTSGHIRWGDASLGRGSMARARIGWVGHEPGLYGDLGAAQNLTLFGSLYGLPEPETAARRMLERVGLGDVPAHKPVRAYSRGMQQRLALARALLSAPELLLLDEPGSALDPSGAAWLAREIAAERQAGRVVVVVTHDLELAGALAEHLLILRRGRPVLDETRAGPLGAPEVRRLYAEKVGG